MFVPSEKHKHGMSIQSSISLGDTLLRIMGERETAETRFLGSYLYSNHLSYPRFLNLFIGWLRVLVLVS